MQALAEYLMCRAVQLERSCFWGHHCYPQPTLHPLPALSHLIASLPATNAESASGIGRDSGTADVFILYMVSCFDGRWNA